MHSQEDVTMVTMDAKTVAKKENFVCGLLSADYVVSANLSFGEITLFSPRTCLRVISCSM